MFPLHMRSLRALLCGAPFLFAAVVSGVAVAQVQPANPPPPQQAPRQNPPPAPSTAPSADPGVRGGIADVGGPLADLDIDEANFFLAALKRFEDVNSVSGALPGEEGRGLGPRFNGNSCAGCHAYPASGGSSPALNPQTALATLHGASNIVPSFITRDGPVREARFVRNADGTPDGGVHDLFVVSGRSDAGSCAITQPDFAGAVAANNVTFRIPTPTFGLGLVENTPDDNLTSAFAANAAAKTALGIGGHFNHSANDGTITKFGWKAQNKSLLMFAGEAYNVEQGVTNDLFPNERETAAGCQFNATPEDSVAVASVANVTSQASALASDIVNSAMLMRFLAAPTPAAQTTQTQHGAQVFASVGCALCHIPTQATAASHTVALNKANYHPFSDFAVHDMGRGLADGITQGTANGREWRTAPLWGLGQRIFFLHDGRTKDLDRAITAHASDGSEANAVVTQYDALPQQDRTDLLAFLRSL